MLNDINVNNLLLNEIVKTVKFPLNRYKSKDYLYLFGDAIIH